MARYSHNSTFDFNRQVIHPVCIFTVVVLLQVSLVSLSGAEDKAAELTAGKSKAEEQVLFLRPAIGKQTAHRVLVGNGDAQFPLVVVRGTPYEMGRQLGAQLKDEIHKFIPSVVEGLTQQMNVAESRLVEVWSRTAAFADDRVEQELAGLADGSGLSLSTLQAAHALPLLMPYSCSSIAAWGTATVDGHLYQTRNLDWNMEFGAHNFPVIIMYLPDKGTPHVVPTFAGFVGAHTGMNTHGIALSEMGDSPGKEAPYQVHAPHFTIFFRTLLYDADSLTTALKIFEAQPLTKRYHFVFGDGMQEHRAVKIRAHSSESAGQQVVIFKDNDPRDEFAPNVSTCLVYNDEGRGAFPHLKESFGKLDGEKMIAIANKIPIKGGNVINVVYDATALKFWVSYAKGTQEAYQRPYVQVDMKMIDADGNGTSDLEEYAKIPLVTK